MFSFGRIILNLARAHEQARYDAGARIVGEAKERETWSVKHAACFLVVERCVTLRYATACLGECWPASVIEHIGRKICGAGEPSTTENVIRSARALPGTERRIPCLPASKHPFTLSNPSAKINSPFVMNCAIRL